MKIKNSIKCRCILCKRIRRNNILYIICKNKKHKQRQF